MLLRGTRACFDLNVTADHVHCGVNTATSNLASIISVLTHLAKLSRDSMMRFSVGCKQGLQDKLSAEAMGYCNQLGCV